MKPYDRNAEKCNLKKEADALYEFLRPLKFLEFDVCSDYIRAKEVGEKKKAREYFQLWQDVVMVTHNTHEKHHRCHCFELSSIKIGNYILHELIC